MLADGAPETVIVTDSVSEQSPLNPVTSYVMVDVGVATTVASVVDDKDVTGVQEYVVAPLAVIVTEEPEQIFATVGVTTTSNGGAAMVISQF